MQINCPHCGSRDVREFTYMGDASRDIPVLDADFDTWARYVWERVNPCGPHEEHWQHSHGCRQFMKVNRNTATHEILSVVAIGPFSGEKPQ